MTSYRKYLLIRELRFDVILYSKLGNENSDAGHSKRSREPQVPKELVHSPVEHFKIPVNKLNNV